MFSLFLRRILFSSASLTVLATACFIGTAWGQREAVPPTEPTKPVVEPAQSAELTSVDTPTPLDVSEPKESIAKKAEKTRSTREKLPAKKQLRLIALSGSYDDLIQPASIDPTSLLLGQTPAKSKSFYRLCEYLQEMGDEENLTHVLFDLSDSDIGLLLHTALNVKVLAGRAASARGCPGADAQWHLL